MKKSPIKQKKIIWGEMEIIELSESDEDEVKIIEEIIPKKEINSKENTNKKKIDKNEIIIIDKDEEEKELEKEEKKKDKNYLDFSENDDWLERSIKTSKKPISKNNIGYKLMVKMGYKDGNGLGKKNNGTKVPINPFNLMNFRKVGIGNHLKNKSKFNYE